MPRIFDNIDLQLPALKETLQLANRADLCKGYFRGWKPAEVSDAAHE